MLTYIQAIIMGIVQGITEPFPISSLGHNVLVPELFGWHNIVNSEPKSESFFLGFIVVLHLATALALFIFYRKEWYKMIAGFFSSIKNRKITTNHERMIWLLIFATIPAGIIGVLLEHVLRTQFAKPMAAAVFLIINGLVLFIGDRYAKKQAEKRDNFRVETTVDHTVKSLSAKKAGVIGLIQTFALLAGFSREGVTMVAGLYNKLDYQDAARFSFFLATPIIFAAGIYESPDFFGHLSAGLRGQMLIGAIMAFITTFLAVKFLDRYFRNKTLKPFGIYCVLFGAFMVVFTAVAK